MGYEVFTIPALPGRIIIGRDSKYLPGGAFCLDFGKTLILSRAWKIGKWRFGPVNAYTVPIIHQNDDKGGFRIVVGKEDGCFTQIRQLWDDHYPEHYPLRPEFDAFKVIGEFARQFPEFST
jgi:hypothetical protein